MNVESISTAKFISKNGILYNSSDTNLSYPSEGNEMCFQLEDNSYWFKHRNRIVSLMIAKYKAHRNVFADVGGGNGFVSMLLQTQLTDVILIEPGPQGVINASKRGVKNVICSVLDQCKFINKSIEMIGMFDVVEHIEHPNNILQESKRVLTDDGLLFLTVPAFNFLWSNEDKSAGHFTRYTKSTMKNLLHTNGFEPVFMSYFFQFLTMPIFALRSIPSRLGMYARQQNQQHYNQQHSSGSGISNSIVNYFCNKEEATLSAGNQLNFGSSLIVVAKKK